MNGGRSSCQCVHLSFLDGWSIFTFIYEILFPASWKANVWISCSLVMSFSFDLGPFSGVWFLVSSLPFRFGPLLFILFYFIFRSFRWTKTFLGFLLCALEHSFFEATLMARGEKLLSFEVPFSFILRFFSAVWRSYLLCFSAWHLFMPYFPVKCW